MQYWPLTLPAMIVVGAGTVLGMPAAHADGDNNTLIPNNKRLNDGVVANVFTVQHQAGCTNDVKINPQLQLAAQRHARDVLNNRTLDGDIGSDGSTPEGRASAPGHRGGALRGIPLGDVTRARLRALLHRGGPAGRPDQAAHRAI